ncbi:hypothetical protein TYRP_017178 [Tyrophagus putrescentiae]|nr:hypothetical protein TYRP_017178 [Tyrophagus putrescentiae]
MIFSIISKLSLKPEPVNNKQTECYNCYTTSSTLLTTEAGYDNGSNGSNNGNQPLTNIKIVEMRRNRWYSQYHVCKLHFSDDNLNEKDNGVAGGQNGTSTGEYNREIVSNIEFHS